MKTTGKKNQNPILMHITASYLERVGPAFAMRSFSRRSMYLLMPGFYVRTIWMKHLCSQLVVWKWFPEIQCLICALPRAAKHLFSR